MKNHTLSAIRVHLSICIIILSLLFPSCKKDEKVKTIVDANSLLSPRTPETATNVIVLSTDTLRAALTAADTAQLTFTPGIGTDRLKVGVNVVSGRLPLLPNGFIGRITNIKSSNGRLICLTEPIALTDMVKEGALSITNVYTSDKFQSTEPKSNNSVKLKVLNNQTIGGELTVSLDHTFDEDGNPSTKNDQTKVSGSLSSGIQLDMGLTISDAHVKQALFQLTLSKSINVKVERMVTTSSTHPEVILYSKPLGTVEGLIGVIPVVFQVRLTFVLGVNGKVNAKVSAGVSVTETDKFGISLEGEKWSEIKQHKMDFKIDPPNFEVAGRLYPYAGMKLELLPYGIRDVGFFKSDLYLGNKTGPELEMTGNPTTGLSARIKWLTEFSAVAHMTLLGKPIADYDNTFFTAETLIWDKDYNAPVLTTADPTNIGPNGVTIGGNITSTGGLSLLSKGIVYSTGNTPTTNGPKTFDGQAPGLFVTAISGLLPGTTYFYRSYAVNAAGTSYGQLKSFKTTTAGNGSTNPGSPNGNGSSGNSGSSGNGNSGSTGGSTDNGNSPVNTGGNQQPIVYPALLTYPDPPSSNTLVTCDASNVYQSGIINVRVLNVNKTNRSITFEVKNVFGTIFSNGGNFGIVSDLCSGISYAYGAYSEGGQTFQCTIYDQNMAGTKYYYLYTLQTVANKLVRYNAPYIRITY